MLLMRVKLYVFNIVIRSARSVLRHIRCPLHPASWLFLYCQLSRIWCLNKYWINFGATAAVHIHAPVRVNHSFSNFQCILNLRIQVKPRCLLTISLVYEVDKRRGFCVERMRAQCAREESLHERKSPLGHGKLPHTDLKSNEYRGRNSRKCSLTTDL